MPYLAPRSGPHATALLPPEMAEMIVFAQELLIDDFCAKIVVDPFTRWYVLPTVGVVFNMILQAFKHMTMYEHAAGAYVSHLEGHVHADHVMSF